MRPAPPTGTSVAPSLSDEANRDDRSRSPGRGRRSVRLGSVRQRHAVVVEPSAAVRIASEGFRRSGCSFSFAGVADLGGELREAGQVEVVALRRVERLETDCSDASIEDTRLLLGLNAPRSL